MVAASRTVRNRNPCEHASSKPAPHTGNRLEVGPKIGPPPQHCVRLINHEVDQEALVSRLGQSWCEAEERLGCEEDHPLLAALYPLTNLVLVCVAGTAEVCEPSVLENPPDLSSL
jgi:hypothetical protein